MLRVRVTRATIVVILSLAAVSAGVARNCDDWMCGTNGASLNGIWQNGIWENGTEWQGSTLQGTRTRGLPSETTIISSAGLVRVELPR